CGARVYVVYKSVGDKAHLTLKEDWNITTVKWRKNLILIATIENKNKDTKHPEKIHIHIADNSLFIHNLTVNDSGDYVAQTGQWEEEVIKYNLIVQEAVSKPIMDTPLDHQSNSSSACQILVKCSADGETVMYDCNHQHCTLINATSTRVNITINYTDTNGMLECTASNRVSTKRTSIPINNTCSEKQPVLTTTISYMLVLIIIISCTVVFGVVMIGILKLVYNFKKKQQKGGTYQDDKGVNTVYSVVRKPQRTETSADSSTAQTAATTVYDVPSKC
ncbi:SLAM family member 5-like, partial [Clarias magur]